MARSRESAAAREGALRKKRDHEVVEAAAKVFYARGYADASVQDVADELGILKGSLYHYIDTKEDLLFRLLSETSDDVSRILDEVSALEDMDPLERLHLYVRRQVEYNLQHIERVAVYYHDLERLGEERRRDILDRRKTHERFVSQLIAEAQRDGRADSAQDAQVLARCVFATIIWTYKWYRPERDDPDRVAESCADFAIGGLIGGSDPRAAPERETA